MNIHQLSLSYVQEQDRLLLRVNTTDAQELRLWFTRRLCIGFTPLFKKIVADMATKKTPTSDQAAAQLDPLAQKAIAEFNAEASLQGADFKTPYKAEAAKLPLGSEPLLVTEIRMTPQPNGQLQIHFSEKIPNRPTPRSFQIALESKLTHGLLKLLDQALVMSQWGLAGSSEAPLPGEEAAAATLAKPRYLN
jgi:hypothetical protein